MKNFVKKCNLKAWGTIATFALMITSIAVNSTCMFNFYQPKLPDGSEKLRK